MYGISNVSPTHCTVIWYLYNIVICRRAQLSFDIQKKIIAYVCKII